MPPSGVQVRVEITSPPGLDRAFAGLIRLGADLRPVWSDIGAGLVASARDRFEEGRGPDGRAWTPLAATTIGLRKRRIRGKKKRAAYTPKPLLDSGRLRDSVTMRADVDGVEVGSNLAYARIHQLGGKAGRGRKTAIPARPYLGLSDEDRDMIPEVVMDHLRRAAG
ncbi:MAG: phage virion morphogenesis protein [Candidatus Methylomirabilis sp.]|nr:phage virion morphogenesis protein [Deltaproteobacteria bacterium]